MEEERTVTGCLIEQRAVAPLRAMLEATQRLEAVVREQERRQDDPRSIARSTRVLIKLMEDWCIDYAIRNRLDAMDPQWRAECGTAALLAALREFLDCEQEDV